MSSTEEQVAEGTTSDPLSASSNEDTVSPAHPNAPSEGSTSPSSSTSADAATAPELKSKTEEEQQKKKEPVSKDKPSIAQSKPAIVHSTKPSWPPKPSDSSSTPSPPSTTTTTTTAAVKSSSSSESPAKSTSTAAASSSNSSSNGKVAAAAPSADKVKADPAPASGSSGSGGGLSSGVAASQIFEKGISGLKNSKRIIKVEIKNEAFVDSNSLGNGSGIDWKSDFDKLGTLVSMDAACYLFYKKASNQWLMIHWMPEGALKVKERMLYASSSDSVKKAFGIDHVIDEIHASSKDDLTLKHYLSLREGNPDELLSASEKAQRAAHAQEEIARKEQTRRVAGAIGKSSDNSIDKPTNAKGIGGYHAVSVPFEDAAREKVEQLIASATSDSVNLVELMMGEGNKTIALASAAFVAPDNLNRHIIKDEPRFYIYRSSPTSIVFLYCCPGSSQPKHRMVYSTSKPSVTQTLSSMNAKAVNIESSDAGEITHKFILSELELAAKAARAETERGKKTAAATKAPETVSGQHPVYGLIGGGGSSASSAGKKKIVMPPAHAYG